MRGGCGYFHPMTSVSASGESVSPSLYDWCVRLGWNVTESRLAILRAVLELQDFKTADELVVEIKRFHGETSRATVYRALGPLCDIGLLVRTDFGSGPQRFSRALPGQVPSAEIYVEECGKVLRVPAPFLTWYAQAITSRMGLELSGQRLQTFARCSHKKLGGDCASCPREEAIKASPPKTFPVPPSL